MPNIKSAKKRMQLSRRWATHNRAVRARIRTAVKRVRESETVETAEPRLREAISLLDRAARRRLLHPKKVDRVKSQLHRHVNQLRDS